MDFIERLFGVAPDGGNGMTELGLLLATAIIAVLVVSARRLARRRVPRGW